MAKHTRKGQDALKHGKWRYRRPSFDTLDESAAWGRKIHAKAASLAEQVKVARCFGYTRVSSNEQAGHGHSLEYQADQILAHFHNRVLKKHPHLTWGEMVVDPGESAYKKKFLQRPGGSRVNAMLSPGDHIIFAKMDRAFRQGADYFHMSELWGKRGIIVHYIDPDIDGSTASGWFMLGQWAMQAEYFSRLLSERTRDGIKKWKEKGMRSNLFGPDVGKCLTYSRSKGQMVEVPADPEYWDKLAKAAELLSKHGQNAAAGLFNDWLHRNDPEYKRPVESRYRYSRDQLLRLAARHVGIMDRNRHISPYEIREKYAEMQAANASACTEPSDSVSP